MVPGTPPQADGRTIPAGGLAVVVASDDDPRLTRRPIVSLPISYRDLVEGSGLAGSPLLAAGWFRDHDHTFSVTVKFGAHAYDDRRIRTVDRILHSIR